MQPLAGLIGFFSLHRRLGWVPSLFKKLSDNQYIGGVSPARATGTASRLLRAANDVKPVRAIINNRQCLSRVLMHL